LVLHPHPTPVFAHHVSLVGTAIGASAQAQSLVGQMRARVAGVAAHLRGITTRPSVFYEIEFDKGSAYTYGKGTFGDALINLAGGTNVGDTTKGAYPQMSTEQLIAAAPQVIVLGDAAFGVSAHSVGQRPGFSAIPAVRSGHIFAMNDDLVSRPGPRIVDGLEQLARLLHPKAFAP
jgi:iron complex transport system substrate-binding protein